MGYPTDYLRLIEEECGTSDQAAELAQVRAVLAKHRPDLVVARQHPPFGGQIARVRIDAYGESAGEVEATLLEYASRCDAASQASEVAYGECVIERNLDEEWGKTYSWRGRLILHPTIGSIPSTERAVAALERASQ